MEKQMYPKGAQVLKQLVSCRNTQEYRADSLTAQTPGFKKERKPVNPNISNNLKKIECFFFCLFFAGIRSHVTVLIN